MPPPAPSRRSPPSRPPLPSPAHTLKLSRRQHRRGRAGPPAVAAGWRASPVLSVTRARPARVRQSAPRLRSAGESGPPLRIARDQNSRKVDQGKTILLSWVSRSDSAADAAARTRPPAARAEPGSEAFRASASFSNGLYGALAYASSKVANLGCKMEMNLGGILLRGAA
jgi:hypothetical protein